MNRPTLLLNPGPVTLSERVRNALLREDQCHREPEFAELMLDIKARLSRLYPQAAAEFDAVVMTGSGTCAVEAMIASLAPTKGRTLIVSNGVYGERISAMLEMMGRPAAEVRCDWLSEMDLTAVAMQLSADPQISHVVAVHNETTTGRLNDIEPLADLCRQHDAYLMLDAVSSFGAEAIDFSHPNLLAVAATSNKCLHAIVGCAFVMVRKRVFEERKSQANTLYLDLFSYHQAQQEGFSPFTQATHSCFALQEALMELDESGGWQARRDRYRTLSGRIRNHLNALGIPCLLAREAYSSMITSFGLPEGWRYPDLHDRLCSKGFVIYAGQGALYHDMFRICNMGDIRDEDLLRLFDCLTAILD
ncbi:MAG: 2-aminoethylphosphonate aminotransferase [Candidatus Thiodiazotropha sp. (ex Troendleina suluensis)]|nr:2-aminoethylphosphonate aminotransferase [Candidatus Thiodiazotropha sp. (ex Troendleina suluensis)]